MPPPTMMASREDMPETLDDRTKQGARADHLIRTRFATKTRKTQRSSFGFALSWFRGCTHRRHGSCGEALRAGHVAARTNSSSIPMKLGDGFIDSMRRCKITQ